MRDVQALAIEPTSSVHGIALSILIKMADKVPANPSANIGNLIPVIVSSLRSSTSKTLLYGNGKIRTYPVYTVHSHNHIIISMCMHVCLYMYNVCVACLCVFVHTTIVICVFGACIHEEV